MADTTLPGVLLTGDHASRPAANAVATGTLYACSTHGLIYQSDGSAWSTWATLGGGAVAAEDVSITDAGAYFTGTDVEAALQELGAGGGGGGGGLSAVTYGKTSTGASTHAISANQVIVKRITATNGGTLTGIVARIGGDDTAYRLRAIAYDDNGSSTPYHLIGFSTDFDSLLFLWGGGQPIEMRWVGFPMCVPLSAGQIIYVGLQKIGGGTTNISHDGSGTTDFEMTAGGVYIVDTRSGGYMAPSTTTHNHDIYGVILE